MENILLPIAGLFLSLLNVILFRVRVKKQNNETRVYSRMTLASLFLSILAIAMLVLESKGNIWITITSQKIYMATMLLIILYMIHYNIVISKFKPKTTKNLTLLFDLSWYVIVFISFITRVTIIDGEVLAESVNKSTNLIMASACIYLIITITFFIRIVMVNSKNIKKNIPFIVIIILYISGLVLRNYIEPITYEPFFFSFALAIMYHTIDSSKNKPKVSTAKQDEKETELPKKKEEKVDLPKKRAQLNTKKEPEEKKKRTLTPPVEENLDDVELPTMKK